MKTYRSFVRSPWFVLLSALTVVGVTGYATVTADGSVPVIVGVEEDWVLSLGEVDANMASPQVATQMNPMASRADVYAIFCLNFQEIPTFIEGGLEIQFWEGDWNVDVNGDSQAKLDTDNEVVQWTQTLRVVDGKLVFGVKNGHSTTYGSFGGDYFKVCSESSYENLATYTAAESVKNSGITLGANRVKSLKLKQVRLILSDGTVVVDTAEKIAYQQPSTQ